MAALTFYLADADITAGVLETLALSAPSSLEEAQGWTVDNKTAPNFCLYIPDTVQARGNFVTTEPSAFSQKGYRSPDTYNGTFASGSWVLYFKVKSGATYFAQTGTVRFRLWRNVAPDGSGATQITSGWIASNTISFTAANQYRTGSITWNSSSVILTNEYLFLEIEWSCNNSGGNNSAIVYWVHNEGASEQLATPDFTQSSVSGTLAGTLANLAGGMTGGGALSLAAADWFVVLPPATNFRYLGMVFNDADGNLAPFYQERSLTTWRTPVELASGALNGYTLVDLGLAAPPTARQLMGFAAAMAGYDLKLAVSYDGSAAALLLHGTPPANDFQGVRGAVPFACRVLEGNKLYLNNDNTANQTVKITGWRE